VKDVSESLAAASRGDLTGIAVSHCAIGEGVNAGNIRRVLQILAASAYTGVLSIECEGAGGPLIERSLRWLRQTVDAINPAVSAGAPPDSGRDGAAA
jgi:sugar phosphate isomerase/epimerase